MTPSATVWTAKQKSSVGYLLFPGKSQPITCSKPPALLLWAQRMDPWQSESLSLCKYDHELVHNAKISKYPQREIISTYQSPLQTSQKPLSNWSVQGLPITYKRGVSSKVSLYNVHVWDKRLLCLVESTISPPASSRFPEIENAFNPFFFNNNVPSSLLYTKWTYLFARVQAPIPSCDVPFQTMHLDWSTLDTIRPIPSDCLKIC